MRSFVRRPTFYIVYHPDFLASFLNHDGHSLQDCDFDKYILRSETVAERAPLLHRAGQSSRDHPIFMRVCHSPWYLVSQRGLFLIRGTLALYLTAILFLSILRDWTCPIHARLFVFDARNLSLFVQAIYYWITAVGLIISKKSSLI